MNIKEYISSGILEAYVLGELDADESANVEKNLMLYPELKYEVAQIEEAQEKFIMHAAMQPPVDVKQKLFGRINEKKPAATSVRLESPTLRLWKLAAAASVTLAIIACYLAYEYRLRWRNSESSLSALIAQNEKIAQDYNQVNERLNKLENDLEVKDNPQFTRVVLEGTENAPGAMAYVYWNRSSNEVYLSIKNMKTLARENQYQLWAIIDGKPVDAGVFDVNTAGLLKMKRIGRGATTFAVTIEPLGGKYSPSLQTLQVIGTVGKG